MFTHQPRRGSHSSRPWIAPWLKQPTRASRGETPLLRYSARPLFGLAPGGVCHAGAVARTPVRSCRTLSPLPVRFPSIGGILSVALSLGFAPEGTRRAGVTRHPCFVEPGLSSAFFPLILSLSKDAAARPPGRAYLVAPRSRSKSNWNRIARTWPSIWPSMRCGRQRR